MAAAFAAAEEPPAPAPATAGQVLLIDSFGNVAILPATRLQPDFQVVWNPVFSPDAGPVTVFQLRYILSW